MPKNNPAASENCNPENFALANCIRALSIDAVEAAQSGHPGAPMGMADAATVLFRNHLKFDSSAPDWPDGDRFILSNGHASMMLYSLPVIRGMILSLRCGPSDLPFAAGAKSEAARTHATRDKPDLRSCSNS